jgi:hypothetical protein
MDTINTMATAAAKAVWGEPSQQKEPVSGKTGDVTKGEPFDAGNLGGEAQGTDHRPNYTIALS